jgi:hypothetical protein
MKNRAKFLTTTLSTSLLILGSASIVHCQDLKEVCASASNPTCRAVAFASGAINPSYGTGGEQQVTKDLAELGWQDVKQLDNLSVPLANGKDHNIDAQAVLAKQVVNGKTYYLVSFRGTEPNKALGNLVQHAGSIATLQPDKIRSGDITTDLVFPQVDFEGGGKVHAGFNRYTQAVIQDKSVQEMIKEIQSKSPDSYEVIVTGHSLGGAAAGVFTAHLQNLGIPTDSIQTVTFAAPVPGNPEFTNKFLNNAIKVEITSDGVPAAPSLSSFLGGDYHNDYGNLVTIDNIDSREGKQRDQKIKDLEGELAKLPWWDPRNLLERDKLEKQIGKLREENINAAFNAAFNRIPILRTILSHNNYPQNTKRDYDIARGTNITPSWTLVGYMQDHLRGITQGGSSRIGSAGYYLGGTAQTDTIDISNAQQVNQFSGGRKPSIQQIDEYVAPGSQVNLKAPVDVVLRWDQSVAAGQLDLDSHLTGPTGLGADSPVRFHVNFSDKGSINTAPYVQLYRDVIPSSGKTGPEQTRIQVLQDGVYRFYVHDWTNKNKIDSPELSQAGANVTVYTAGRDLPREGENLGTPYGGAINAPNDQLGNVWYTFQLDSRTGILRRVNVPFGNVSERARVPSVGE